MGYFDKYKSELDALNLSSTEDLENLVVPLVKDATIIEVQKPSVCPENSSLNSHFGGQPYFEQHEKWPKAKRGQDLDFVFQIFNEEGLMLPPDIRLVQLFYDWEEFPWETEDDGWLVKVYREINPQRRVTITRPSSAEKTPYCEVTFSPTKSLPDWEGIRFHSPSALKLSCVLNEDQPWENYQQIARKIVGEQDYRSQLGGYPHWIQGESTPVNQKDQGIPLLFQIDSESNAGLMWGDTGLIYAFYDGEADKSEFVIQCC